MNLRVNVIFIAIVVSGLVLRLYKLDIPLLEFYPTRQVQTADVTRNFYLGHFNLLTPSVWYIGPEPRKFLVEFPAYNYIVLSVYKIIGSTNEIAGRVVSVIGWLIASIFLFKLAKETIGTGAAFIALFFYTFSPLSVLVSRSFQPDQWVLTLSIASIYLIYKASDSGSRRLFFLSSILASISLLMKFHSIFFTIIPILYFLKKSSSKFSAFERILFLSAAIAPSAIWYIYAGVVNVSESLQNQSNISNWFGANLFINPKYYLNIFGFLNNLVILPVGMVLFLFGILTKLRVRQHFLYWYLAGVIIYFAAFNKHSSTHEYYHLPFLAVASFFIGIGAQKIINNIGGLAVKKYVLLAACFLTIAVTMLPPTLARAYKPIERFKYVPETAQKIRTFTKPDDLVIGAMDGGPALVYYCQRPGWSFDINRTEVSEQDLIFNFKSEISTPVDELEALRDQGAKVFASASKAQFLENSQFSQYMYKLYPVLFENNNYIIFNLEKTND